MIGIVIVAHGGLAREYLAAMEHVVGRHPGTVAVAIGAEDDCTTKQDEIDAAIRAVDDGEGVVVVTDMFGGTPSNLAMEACRESNRMVVYGANLPLLVKLAKARRLPLREAVATALTAGRKYINSVEGLGPDRLPIAL
ncbi:PTS fructose transporter subunit IIA [Amaricoccus sp.]|uniref:PTS sugar transporter subunit IIA n=1 Tax=Amaricoccus sp. TaxID=1872485 RepID=UPI001B4B80F8|nr:PTS fructose transporter subunit IIA [Amaricoccus sp.]MBP6999961.1 PTS fructose transporter subunit IIA [Amaricoccus sp.]